jgi:Glycosyl hydrolase family 30 beta sandwich domain
MRIVGYSWIGLVSCLAASLVDAQTASSTIKVDPSITYQTFDAWESVFLSSVQDYTRVLPAYETVLDEAVNDLGITRMLIGISSGIEHPPGNGEQYVNGTMPEGIYFSKYAYDIVNDNSNPNVANLDGFDFATLDWRMEHLVLPMERRVEARGEKFYAYLSYVDFGKSKFEHWAHPEEYAEFMLVLFDHLKTKYGFVPNGINVVNEPDNNTEWTADAIGRVVAKTGPRLAAAGYHPDFMAPAVMNRAHAVPFFEDAIRVKGAKQYITGLTYHCYADTGRDSLARIAEAGVRYGVKTVMNECWGTGNTHQFLHRDLKVARASVWQQGALSGPNGYYNIDRATMQPRMNPKTRIMRQYYKYIRPGAKRIEATTSDSAFDPLAFINADGSYVAVIKADSAGSFSIENLPAGTYGISYTTAQRYDVHLPDVVIRAGQEVSASIPQPGVLTVQGKSAPAGAP